MELSHWRVLLVDSSEQDCLSTRAFLTQAKGRQIELVWARSYEEGWEQIIRDNYDAVLVAYELGPRTGIELIRAISEMDYHAPVILYTRRVSYEADVEAMQAGATLYLTKEEANPLLLERAIRYAIEMKQKEQALRASEAKLRQREAQAEESEQRFRAVLENSLDLAYRRDLIRDCYDYMSPAVAQVMGLTEKEMNCMPTGEVLERVHPEDRAAVEAQLVQSVAEGRGTLEYRFRGKDGQYRWLSDHFTVQCDAAGRALTRNGIVRDISATKAMEAALREREERFRLSVENLLDAFAIYSAIRDADGKIVDFEVAYVNEAACKLTGRTWAEYLGQTVLDMHPGLDKTEIFAWYVQAVETGEVIVKENYALTTTSNNKTDIRYFDYRITRLGDGFTSTWRDVTERVAAAEALRQSEERFRHLADAMPQLVWTANSAGVVDYYNRRAEEYHDITPGENRKYEWTRVVHPDDVAFSLSAWLRSVRTGEPYQMEQRMRMADGDYRWHLTRAVAVRDSAGEIVKWYGTSTDIDALKRTEAELGVALRQAEESQRTLEAIMAFVPEGITITGGPPDFPVLKMSRYGLQMVGAAKLALLGIPTDQHQNAWQVRLPDGETVPQSEQMPLYRASRLGEVVQGAELLMGNAEGRFVPVLVNAAPIRDHHGAIIGAINVWRDISERKAYEQKLKEYADKLARSNQELQNFAYIASHDLQEPLRKISSFGEILQDRLGDKLDPDAQDVLQRMLSASKRMRQMVDQLLELSRVNTRGGTFRAVDLGQVAAVVLEDLEGRVRQTGGQVQVGSLPTIEGDPIQLHQLLQNLIGNALKFHKPEARPIVRVWCEAGPQQVTLHVADDGIGFEEQYTQQIFQPFRRLNGRSQYEGTGMGLAICKRIVERHKGTISVHSQPGQGTTFEVTLPVSQNGDLARGSLAGSAS